MRHTHAQTGTSRTLREWQAEADRLVGQLRRRAKTPASRALTVTRHKTARQIVRALHTLTAVVGLIGLLAVAVAWRQSARQIAEVEQRAAALRTPSGEAHDLLTRGPVTVYGSVAPGDVGRDGFRMAVDVDRWIDVRCSDATVRGQLSKLGRLLTRRGEPMCIEVRGTVGGPEAVDAGRLRRVEQLPGQRVCND